MPHIDIGTYKGLIPQERKKEIALKVRELLAKELSKDEGTFLVTLTGVEESQWRDYITSLRSEKEVILEFEPKK